MISARMMPKQEGDLYLRKRSPSRSWLINVFEKPQKKYRQTRKQELLQLYKSLKTFSLVRSYDVEDDIRCVICCEPLDAAEFQSSCNIVEMFENHNLQSVISTLEDVVGGKFNIYF